MAKPHIKVVYLDYCVPPARVYALYTDRTCTKRLEVSRSLTLLCNLARYKHSAAFPAPKPVKRRRVLCFLRDWAYWLCR